MDSGGSTSRSAEVINAATTTITQEERSVENNVQLDRAGRRRYTGELIEDERSRVLTYRRRSKGLKKKIYELSTLCDVDACMIMYGPEHRNLEPVKDTWPENDNEMHRILDRYFGSEEGRNGRAGSARFASSRREKIEEEIAMQRKKNEMLESYLWDSQIEGLCEDQLKELLAKLELRSEVVQARLEAM